MSERCRKVVFVLAISLLSSSFLGAQADKPPDKEMLRLMELLREWEMIKNIDVLKDFEDVERQQNAPAGHAGQQKAKETKK